MSYVTVVNGDRLSASQLEARRRKNADRFATNMRDILSSRRAPRAETDDTYLANFGTLLNQFDGDERALEVHLENCAEHGFTPGDNDVYLPTLARFPGDPQAHVKSRGEAVRYAEQQGTGLQINGREVVKSREPEEDPWDKGAPLDDDLIRKSVPDMLKSNPKLAGKPQELREAIIDKHALK